MRVPRLRFAALALASGIILSGCAYDMYGDDYGYGYGYGPRSSVSIGYGYGYPYGGYYDPFGWYGDFYYPGTGIYVYDRYRHRHQWTDDQRRYWLERRSRWQNHSGTTTTTSSRENWSGWNRSRWRNHNNSTTTTSATTSISNDGSRRSWSNGNRDNWQSRSSVTTRSERSQRSSDGGRRSAERSDERPN
jgi:hypothetical protein